MPDQKIFCANCLHCKIVSTPDEAAPDTRRLRVRCAQGMWQKKSGEEKFYKYFTVSRRSVEACEHYEDMGELEDYLKDLRDTLPISDEVYTPEGAIIS